MKEFIIGGEKHWISWCSSCCWEGSSVSKSEYGYLLHCYLFDCDFYILPKCAEYDKLDYLVTHEGSNYAVEHFANELALEYLSVEDILSVIDYQKKCAYDCGYKAAQSDMRKILGWKE